MSDVATGQSLDEFYAGWEESAPVNEEPIETPEVPTSETPDETPEIVTEPPDSPPAEQPPADPLLRFTPDAVSGLTELPALQSFATEAVSYLQERVPDLEYAAQVREALGEDLHPVAVPLVSLSKALLHGANPYQEVNGQQHDGFDSFLGGVYQQFGAQHFDALTDRVFAWELLGRDNSPLVQKYGEPIAKQYLAAQGVTGSIEELKEFNAWKQEQAAGGQQLTAEEERTVLGEHPAELHATWRGMTAKERAEWYTKEPSDLRKELEYRKERADFQTERQQIKEEQARVLAAQQEERFERAQAVQIETQRAYLKQEVDRYGQVFADPQKEAWRKSQITSQIENQLLYAPQHEALRNALAQEMRNGNVIRVQGLGGQIQKLIHAEVAAAHNQWKQAVPVQSEDDQLARELVAHIKANNPHKLQAAIERIQQRGVQSRKVAVTSPSSHFEPDPPPGATGSSLYQFYQSQS